MGPWPCVRLGGAVPVAEVCITLLAGSNLFRQGGAVVCGWMILNLACIVTIGSGLVRFGNH